MDDFMFTKKSLSTLIKLMKSESSKNLDYYFIDKDFKSPKVIESDNNEFNIKELNDYKDNIAIVNKGYAWQDSYIKLNEENLFKNIAGFTTTKDENNLIFTRENIRYNASLDNTNEKIEIRLSEEDENAINQLTTSTIIQQDSDNDYKFYSIDNNNITINTNTASYSFSETKNIDDDNQPYLIKYKYDINDNFDEYIADNDYYQIYTDVAANKDSVLLNLGGVEFDTLEISDKKGPLLSSLYTNEELSLEESSFEITYNSPYYAIKWGHSTDQKLHNIPIVYGYDKDNKQQTVEFGLYYNNTLPINDVRLRSWNNLTIAGNNDIFPNISTGSKSNKSLNIDGWWQPSDLRWVWNNYWVSARTKKILENNEKVKNETYRQFFLNDNNHVPLMGNQKFKFVQFDNIDNKGYLFNAYTDWEERTAEDDHTFMSTWTSPSIPNIVETSLLPIEATTAIISIEDTTASMIINIKALPSTAINQQYAFCVPSSGGASTTRTYNLAYSFDKNPIVEFRNNIDKNVIQFYRKATNTTVTNNIQSTTITYGYKYLVKPIDGIDAYIIKDDLRDTPAYLVCSSTATTTIQAFHPQTNYAETKYFQKNADPDLGIKILEDRFNNTNLFYDENKFNNDIESEIFNITLGLTANGAIIYSAADAEVIEKKLDFYYKSDILWNGVKTFTVNYSPIVESTETPVYEEQIIPVDNGTLSEEEKYYIKQYIPANDNILNKWTSLNNGMKTSYTENSREYSENNEIRLFQCNDSNYISKIHYQSIEYNENINDNFYYFKKLSHYLKFNYDENNTINLENPFIEIPNTIDLIESSLDEDNFSQLDTNIINNYKISFNEENFEIFTFWYYISLQDNNYIVGKIIEKNDYQIFQPIEDITTINSNDNIIIFKIEYTQLSQKLNNQTNKDEIRQTIKYLYAINNNYDNYFTEIPIGTPINTIEDTNNLYVIKYIEQNQPITEEQKFNNLYDLQKLYSISIVSNFLQKNSGRFEINVTPNSIFNSYNAYATYMNSPINQISLIGTTTSTLVENWITDYKEYINFETLYRRFISASKTYTISNLPQIKAIYGISTSWNGQITSDGDYVSLNITDPISEKSDNFSFKRADGTANFRHFINIPLPNRSWQVKNTAYSGIASQTQGNLTSDYYYENYAKIKSEDFFNLEQKDYLGIDTPTSPNSRTTNNYSYKSTIVDPEGLETDWLKNLNKYLKNHDESKIKPWKEIYNQKYLVTNFHRRANNSGNINLYLLLDEEQITPIFNHNAGKINGSTTAITLNLQAKIYHLINLGFTNYTISNCDIDTGRFLYKIRAKETSEGSTWSAWPEEYLSTTNGQMQMSYSSNDQTATISNISLPATYQYPDILEQTANICQLYTETLKKYWANPPLAGPPIFFKDWVKANTPLKCESSGSDQGIKTKYFHYIKLPKDLKINTNETYLDLPIYIKYNNNNNKVFDTENTNENIYIVSSTESIKNKIDQIYDDVTYTLKAFIDKTNTEEVKKYLNNPDSYKYYYMSTNEDITSKPENAFTKVWPTISNNNQFKFYIKGSDTFKTTIFEQVNKENIQSIRLTCNNINLNDNNQQLEGNYNIAITLNDNNEEEQKYYKIYSDAEGTQLKTTTIKAQEPIPFTTIKITLNNYSNYYTINNKNYGHRHIFIPIQLNNKYTPSWDKDHSYPNGDYRIDNDGILRDNNDQDVSVNGTFSIAGNNGGTLVQIRGFNDAGEYTGDLNGSTINNAKFGTGILAINDITDASRKPVIDRIPGSVKIKPIDEGGNIYASIVTAGGIASAKTIKGERVFGAIWNDYAEYRQTEAVKPGNCVIEQGNGTLKKSNDRLQAGANIVSDTFGFGVGETTNAKTPIAVSGRVLAYPLEDRDIFKPGEAVCSGPNGTISRMTREEIREWPDRIVGYVSEIPHYQTWGTGKIKVDGRIWIKVH